MLRFAKLASAAVALAVALGLGLSAGSAQDSVWKSLFNGKDLAGWDTWLGRPYKTSTVEGLKKNEKGEYTEVVGLNKDPNKVYTVVDADGRPAVRISGEIFGAITSVEEFENYHFRLEFKWGEKKWFPREKAVRDSGILYHCVGPQGASGFWMKSQECQVQEKDCGDYWSVAGATIDIPAEKRDGKGPWIYKPGAEKVGFGGGTKNGPYVKKDPDNEKPSGQWNVIEVMCVGGTSVHIVNGKTTMVLYNSRHRVDGKEVPLTRGKIQIQSEGAEVFYRKMEIRPLKEIPADVLK
jgi:hypothetical protein